MANPLPPLRAQSLATSGVWQVLSALSQDALGQVLALALLLAADSTVFDFDSVAPSWPAESLVIAERRRLSNTREPAPIWLKSGLRTASRGIQRGSRDGPNARRLPGSVGYLCQRPRTALGLCRAGPEVTYCLTEHHAYDAAGKAQQKVSASVRALEELSGLIDPMWHHQQGRLFYYYAGNYEGALLNSCGIRNA